MAQIEPKHNTLSVTHFGRIRANASGKAELKTQTLYVTWFGRLLSGNDWITVTVQQQNRIRMMI